MRGAGTIRVALAFALLLSSQALVVWRQSRSLEALRELDALRRERAGLESERANLTSRASVLEGRARIRKVAESRLGMHVPTPGDIVILERRVRIRVVPGDPARVAFLTDAVSDAERH